MSKKLVCLNQDGDIELWQSMEFTACSFWYYEAPQFAEVIDMFGMARGEPNETALVHIDIFGPENDPASCGREIIGEL